MALEGIRISLTMAITVGLRLRFGIVLDRMGIEEVVLVVEEEEMSLRPRIGRRMGSLCTLRRGRLLRPMSITSELMKVMAKPGAARPRGAG